MQLKLNQNRMGFCRQTVLLIVSILSCAGLVHGCACTKNIKHCAKIYQISADYQTAQEMCKEQGGRLSIQSNATEELVGYLVDNTIGHFWLGLQPPGDKCVNEKNNTTTEFTNSETEEKCVQRCLSVSNDRQLTVRSCADKVDGFLCEDSQGDLCKGNVVIVDNSRCTFAPCEHHCTPVKNGYTCSCRERFRPNARDPRRCDLFCPTTVCEALCIRGGLACWCPRGFVRSDRNCEDIDECDSNAGCAHKCINTLGSYKCACYDPFILVNETECTLGLPLSQKTPSPNYVAQGAMSTPGEYIGLIIFLVLAVFALLALVYYLRNRKGTTQESNPPAYDDFQGSVSP